MKAGLVQPSACNLALITILGVYSIKLKQDSFIKHYKF